MLGGAGALGDDPQGAIARQIDPERSSLGLQPAQRPTARPASPHLDERGPGRGNLLILLVGLGVTWTVAVKVIGFAWSFLSHLFSLL